MAEQTKYATLVAKAEEHAALAMRAEHLPPGPARGSFYAGLAAMWMEAARVELQATEYEAIRRSHDRIRSRLKRVEAELKVWVPAEDLEVD